MSDTTAAEPKAQNFVMPKPTPGQAIIYYHGGSVHEGNASVAYVLRVGASALEISHRGLHYDSVRHIDDPKAAKGKEHRQPGLWDFTDQDKHRAEEMASLQRRLRACEQKVAFLRKKAGITGKDDE